jgi:fructokinase
LLSRFDAGTVILTRGAKGADVVTADEVLRGSPAPVERLVDAVGAGDAFSAVFIAGILSGWSPATTLERALRFASAVCGIRGATTDARALYDAPRAAWDKESDT